MRRSPALIAVATLLLGACGSDDPVSSPTTAAVTTTSPTATPASTDPAPAASTAPTESSSVDSAAAATRVVETPSGPVEVPTDPQRITVLDEYAGMSLLALGVTPTVVYGAFGSEVGQTVLAAAGVDVREVAGFSRPNVEDVAATKPDLIVFSTEGGLTEAYADLSAVAPTVELPYTVPFDEALLAAADAVDKTDEAERLIDLLDERIAELRDDVLAEPMTLSILGDTYGMVFAASTLSPMARLVESIGFTRPAAQANGQPDATYDSAIMISTELLGDHDGDAVVVLSGAFYNAETFLSSPTYQALPAVRDGRSVVVDGDLWFGTFPFAVFWTLEDLAAIHGGLGQDGIGDADDVAARWASYEAFVS